MDSSLMTVHEVAETLRIKACSVYQLYHRGTLPGVRIKEMNALRFQYKDVISLIEKRKVKK